MIYQLTQDEYRLLVSVICWFIPRAQLSDIFIATFGCSFIGSKAASFIARAELELFKEEGKKEQMFLVVCL